MLRFLSCLIHPPLGYEHPIPYNIPSEGALVRFLQYLVQNVLYLGTLLVFL
jgi:hypothetical protein